MRILVISDSHRDSGAIEKAVLAQPEAKDIFFLGDLTADIENIKDTFPDRTIHAVCGNCDFFSDYPTCDIANIGGRKIFYTHGHNLCVKYTTSILLDKAKEEGCDIALYGHTHISSILYEDGVYMVNPGSCAQARGGRNSYAVIDITPSGIMPIIVEL